MTAETLSLLAGAVLSLLFSYVPGLNSWFDTIKPEFKRLTMAGLTFVVAAAAYGLSCAGLGEQLKIAVVCDQAGAIALVQAWVLALVANQATYGVTPRRK